MAQRITSWFITEKGKKFTFGVACMTSIGIFNAYILPNTWLMNQYKDFNQLYKNGFPVEVPQIVIDRFNKTLELLQIPDTDKQRLKPFMGFGPDIFNIGSIHSKFGGLVGIPSNFSYKTLADIPRWEMVVNHEPVHWEEPEAQQLLNSLILSEKAQLYAIAREILTISSFKLLLNTFYGSSVFILMYSIGNHVNKKFNLYARPMRLRMALYSLVGCFGFGIYVFFKDFTQNYYDQHIDKELCEKNKIFVEGGKEFYEQIAKRNIALRALMGSRGERIYSVFGNVNSLIRHKTIPIVVRREFFTNKLQDTE